MKKIKKVTVRDRFKKEIELKVNPMWVDTLEVLSEIAIYQRDVNPFIPRHAIARYIASCLPINEQKATFFLTKLKY